MCGDALPCYPQVGALYLELLFGQPPLWYNESADRDDRDNIREQLFNSDSVYSSLPNEDKKFLHMCFQVNPGQRKWLGELLGDAQVRAFLGWPDEWQV